MIGDAERNGWLTHHTVLYAHSSCYFSFLIILKDMDPLPGVAFQDDIHRWLEAALVCTDHHKDTEVHRVHVGVREVASTREV